MDEIDTLALIINDLFKISFGFFFPSVKPLTERTIYGSSPQTQPLSFQLSASEDYIKPHLKSVFKSKCWERDASERLAATLKELQSSVTEKF